jgi:hypothetical protein
MAKSKVVGTIKRKDLDALQASIEWQAREIELLRNSSDYWQGEFDKVSGAAIQAYDAMRKEYKTQLWDAEKEIHDLKYQIELQRDRAEQCFDKQDKIIFDLDRENTWLNKLNHRLTVQSMIPAQEPITPQPVSEPKWRKRVGYLLRGMLIGAVIGLLALVVYQGNVIKQQREVVWEMFNYVQEACPMAEPSDN